VPATASSAYTTETVSVGGLKSITTSATFPDPPKLASKIAEQSGRLSSLRTVDLGGGQYDMYRVGPIAGMTGRHHWWIAVRGYGIECMDSLEHEVHYEADSRTVSVMGFVFRFLTNEGGSA